jgi:hypothetical protein
MVLMILMVLVTEGGRRKRLRGDCVQKKKMSSKLEGRYDLKWKEGMVEGAVELERC